MASSRRNLIGYLENYETQHTRFIKFGLFVALTPPALICNFILIYYLITDRTLRHNIQYHAILALLIATLLTNLVDVPYVMHYLRTGIVFPEKETHCLIWQWCDYSLFSAVNIYMFWISFERYLLIFRGGLFTTARHRLLFHYLPLIIIIVYILLFYAGAIFIYSCERQLKFNQTLCGPPCYTTSGNISSYDVIAHTAIPVALGTMIDTILIIRVLFRKRVGLQRQRTRWRRYRKMVIQILSITSLYVVCQVPAECILFIKLYVTLPDWVTYIQIVYFYYLFWLLTFLLPFACIGCMPEVINKLKNSFIQRRRRNMMRIPMNTFRLQNRPYVT
jgi:hypothetical protein